MTGLSLPGAVILTLVPHLVGLDERAHPSLPYLLNGLAANLVPVEVRRPDGSRTEGEVMYQVNKIKDGYLVLVMNNIGVDKTQSGVARVDRREDRSLGDGLDHLRDFVGKALTGLPLFG